MGLVLEDIVKDLDRIAIDIRVVGRQVQRDRIATSDLAGIVGRLRRLGHILDREADIAVLAAGRGREVARWVVFRALYVVHGRTVEILVPIRTIAVFGRAFGHLDEGRRTVGQQLDHVDCEPVLIESVQFHAEGDMSAVDQIFGGQPFDRITVQTQRIQKTRILDQNRRFVSFGRGIMLEFIGLQGHGQQGVGGFAAVGVERLRRDFVGDDGREAVEPVCRHDDRAVEDPVGEIGLPGNVTERAGGIQNLGRRHPQIGIHVQIGRNDPGIVRNVVGRGSDLDAGQIVSVHAQNDLIICVEPDNHVVL